MPPSGKIKEAFDNAANLYQTKFTFYGVNGSTGNIIAATRLLGGPDKVVLIQRNSHRSAIHGFRATGAEISYIQLDYDSSWGCFAPVTVEQLH